MSTAAILLAVSVDPASGDTVALAPHDALETIVEHEVTELHRAGARDIVVVLGPDAERIIPLVARDNVEPIIDARFAAGEASSLRVGASAVPRGTSLAILASLTAPATSVTYAALMETPPSEALVRIAGSLWPSAIDAELLGELRNLPDTATIEEFFAHHAGEAVTIG